MKFTAILFCHGCLIGSPPDVQVMHNTGFGQGSIEDGPDAAAAGQVPHAVSKAYQIMACLRVCSYLLLCCRAERGR